MYFILYCPLFDFVASVANNYEWNEISSEKTKVVTTPFIKTAVFRALYSLHMLLQYFIVILSLGIHLWYSQFVILIWTIKQSKLALNPATHARSICCMTRIILLSGTKWPIEEGPRWRKHTSEDWVSYVRGGGGPESSRPAIRGWMRPMGYCDEHNEKPERATRKKERI